jgi:outer membrane protein
MLAIVLLANLSMHSMAQDSGAKQWTLKECVDHALENNLTVQRSLLNVQSNDINYDQSKMALLPAVNAGGTYGYNWGRSIDPTSNQFVTARIQSTNANANAQVTLFNGFALRNTINQNKLSFEASKNDLEKSKNDIIQNVILFYMNVIFNQELLKNAQSQLASSDEQLKRAEIQERQGAIAKSNLYDLMAQRATNDVSVINQENQLNLSVLQLKQLLQIPGSESFAVVQPDIDLAEGITLAPASVDQIYRISEQNMPEIKSTDLGIQSADYGLKAAKGNFLPSITASAGLSTNYSDARDAERFIPDGADPILIEQNPEIGFVSGTNAPVLSNEGAYMPSGSFVDGYNISDQFTDNLSKFLSFRLSIPIFNGYQARAGVQRALIQKQQAEITAKESRNTLRQAIETAHNDALSAAKTYNASLTQVQATEEAYRIAQKRKEQTAISNVDFLVAENNFFQATSDLLRAKYDYIFKLKIIDFYQGKTIDF